MKKMHLCFWIICFIICFSTVTLATNFYDIKGTQYEGVVDRVASLGIINGISSTTFAPNKGITRAELAKMIVYTRGLQKYTEEMEFEPIFSDVKSHWAENYIYVAADLQVLNGYEDGTFKPDKEVSYAEVIAIILRCLGYVNIDETEGENWYTGYTKRMYDINLNKGISKFSSYSAPAKRGDVAILWWNMLVSNKWAVTAQNTVSGLYYTYSDKTQLQTLFPDYVYITGTVNSIDGTSEDGIVVEIGTEYYPTTSDVQIYALGATATGVYDTKEKVLYGFSIDDEISDYKIVSGPLFYLEDEDYNINKAKKKVSYGSIVGATYAYLIVSNDESIIHRAVLLNGSKSVVVDTVKIENNNEESKKDDDEIDEEEKKVENIGTVILNDEEFTTTEAAIIKNGKEIKWSDLPKGAILTTLKEDSLYTYETKSFEGEITNYKDLHELYIDNDKYIISSNCVYTIGKNEKDEEVYEYNSKMTKEKLEKLSAREKVFYLNAAEEISKIEFGEYLEEKVEDKYEDSKYEFMYVTSIGFLPQEELISLSGVNVNGGKSNYRTKEDERVFLGDLVVISDISGRNAKYQVIEKNSTFEDLSILYDVKDEFYNDSFGEYTLTENTIIYRVLKDYTDNSNEKVDECIVEKVESISELGDLSKCKINIFYNDDMDIDVLIAERELNKTTYPVARVSEISKIKTDKKDDEKEDTKKEESEFEVVNANFSVINGKIENFNIVSGDCELGELVTFEIKDDMIIIKERFKTFFIGYEKDLCVKSFDRINKSASIEGTNEVLDLKESTYNYNGKEYDLLDFKFLLTSVKKDSTNGNWKFSGGNFYEKENLVLKSGDRIAFNELNGIAVVYRGYTK